MTATIKTSQRVDPGAQEGRDPGALLPEVYDELRRLAGSYLRRERSNHTLQPTALVHEAYERLADQPNRGWEGRSHFFAVSALAMRRVLVDHARKHRRLKRGGDWQRVTIEPASPLFGDRGLEAEDMIALDAALKRLAELDARQAKVVELRYFGGLTTEATAEYLGVSKRTVEGDWTHARLWLRGALASEA